MNAKKSLQKCVPFYKVTEVVDALLGEIYRVSMIGHRVIQDKLHGVRPKAAITERNRLMVTNSDVLVAYIRKESGGVASCVHMAETLDRKIIKI